MTIALFGVIGSSFFTLEIEENDYLILVDVGMIVVVFTFGFYKTIYYISSYSSNVYFVVVLSILFTLILTSVFEGTFIWGSFNIYKGGDLGFSMIDLGGFGGG